MDTTFLFRQNSELGGKVEAVVSSPSPSRSQVDSSSGVEKANGHISRRLVPLRRLGDCEVIPSFLLPSTSGIYHFISAVMEDGQWQRHQSLTPSIHQSPSFSAAFQCQ